MTDFKTLLREPALIIDFVETLLVFLVAFGLGLSGDQQSYIVAAVVAILGLIKAFSTKPFAVAAVTDLGRALLVLGASFGVGLTADQIAIAVTFLGTVTTLLVSIRVTPKYDPVVAVGGAGAGPVRGEAGATNLFYALGVGLLLLAVLLLVLTLLKVVAISYVVLVVLAVIGVVLLLIGGRDGRVGL